MKTFVLWLTGLSGAGKTATAKALREKLSAAGFNVHHLDGDEVRAAAAEKLGFDKEGRDKNIRLAIELAKKYQNNDISIVASFISPYEEHRRWGRNELENYIEVFIDAPLEVCEARDPKGMYKKARTGEIKFFTGVSDPYEAPQNPYITLKTAEITPEEGADAVIEYLKKEGYL